MGCVVALGGVCLAMRCGSQANKNVEEIWSLEDQEVIERLFALCGYYCMLQFGTLSLYLFQRSSMIFKIIHFLL